MLVKAVTLRPQLRNACANLATLMCLPQLSALELEMQLLEATAVSALLPDSVRAICPVVRTVTTNCNVRTIYPLVKLPVPKMLQRL